MIGMRGSEQDTNQERVRGDHENQRCFGSQTFMKEPHGCRTKNVGLSATKMSNTPAGSVNM